MSKTERLIITMDDEKWQRTLIDVLKEDPNCFDVLASFQESPIKWNGFFYPLSTKASFFRKYPVVEFVELDCTNFNAYFMYS